MTVIGPPLPPFNTPPSEEAGSVFPASPDEHIIRLFGKQYYRLVDYSWFPDNADPYADKLEEQTGKDIIIHSFQDPQVARGEFIDFGIWQATGHTIRATRRTGPTKSAKHKNRTTVPTLSRTQVP